MSDSPFGIHHDERTAVFIDGPNLYSAAKAVSFDIDYKKLLTHFKDQSRFIRAYYYTTVIPKSEESDDYSPLRPLIDYLQYNGYSMVTKPMKEFVDEATGLRRQKASMSIEITVDMVLLADHLDHIVLFSGDGDFRRPIEVIQAKGTRVTVVSSMKNGQSVVSDDLRRQADCFIELAELRDVIERHDQRRSISRA